METYYICPTCKAKCGEHDTYCDGCGTWLLSTTHPPKKVTSSNKSNSALAIIIAFAVIGAVVYFGLNATGNQTVVFNDMQIEDSFTISQFIVDPGAPSATADLTALEAIADPLEITAAFYDDTGNRVGLASALITDQLSANRA